MRREHRGAYAVTGRGGRRAVLHHYVDGRPLDTSHGTTFVDAQASFFVDGRAVNRVAKGRYRTRDGEELTSEDPAAP